MTPLSTQPESISGDRGRKPTHAKLPRLFPGSRWGSLRVALGLSQGRPEANNLVHQPHLVHRTGARTCSAYHKK